MTLFDAIAGPIAAVVSSFMLGWILRGPRAERQG